MKPIEITISLSLLCVGLLLGQAPPHKEPKTVEFQGRTYFVEQTAVEDQGKRKVLLYYPNLPGYDDEYYEEHPEKTRDRLAVTEIRCGDFSIETGQVTVLGSLNACLNSIDSDTYPMDSEGKLSYFDQERHNPGFVFVKWKYTENRGFGFYDDGTHFDEDDFHVHIRESGGNFTFHMIPKLKIEMLRQLETEMEANRYFDPSGITPPDSETEESNLANWQEIVSRQTEWDLDEKLMKLTDVFYYLELWPGDYLDGGFAAYQFDPDGTVTLKSLFYFPYPGKEQMLKLYLNATGDVAGEKAWRAEEASGPRDLLSRHAKAHDLGAGRFALYGKLRTWDSVGPSVPLLFFYQLNQEGKPVLEKVTKATEQQAAKGESRGLTKELILAEPAGPEIAFK